MIDSKTSRSPENSKEYWESVYQNRSLIESGWYQPNPASSLRLIAGSQISKKSRIIDVGGGDSLLVDHLLNQGYENITVLDISQRALEKAKVRLGKLAEKVNWICSDVTNLQTNAVFDLWHDRACLHFLTSDAELKLYREKVGKCLVTGGNLIVGTFSKTGPEKCSGLPIRQYDSSGLSRLFSRGYRLVENFESIHKTPANTVQNYVFCRFIKK
ncbi:class I SAM-dependent methyltransferase [Lutimonas vermicola]|uniref:Class I SAM-dependent methyltransferase n=1 Tax=Lutimonas vermicola TaxID=414288 RepID=A0ABU9L0G6_9FLAO